MYKIGQVIELNDGRVATIRFIGDTAFSTGEWIGVEFDDPSGKNDGAVQGQRYFDCAPGHGMFLRESGVGRVLEEPTPKPQAPPPSAKSTTAAQKRVSLASAKGTAATGAGTTAGTVRSRPASLISNGGGFKKPTTVDPMAARRQSINSASPTPAGPRGAAAMNGTKQSPSKPVSRVGSTASSRGATPPVASARRGTVTATPGSTIRNGASTLASRSSATGTTATARTSSTVTGARATLRASVGAAAAPRARVGTVGSSTTAKPAAPTRQPRASIAAQTTRPAPATSTTSRNPSADETNKEEGRDSMTSQEDHDDSDGSSKENLNEQQTEDSEVDEAPPEKMNGHATKPAASVPSASKHSSRQPSTSKPATGSIRGTSVPNKHIQELEMKLESMEKRHSDDKEKLKTLERLQTERDRFESIIQRLQAKYQPQQQELNDIKKKLKEREERLSKLENDEAEHETTLEMATLDREMAEETAETLRTELDVLKQRLEEVELEVEVLRDENTEFSKEMSPEERTSAGWLQLERSNERMREALIRLRDMTQAQEAELRDHVASLEEDLKLLDGIKDQYEETKEKLKQSEVIIDDLRQQLETALGADDMIEELTEKNLALAEQITDLQMNVEDLENLKELNDELELNHVETEKQMQDELDYRDAVLMEAARRTAQQEDKLTDQEYTIGKFRELVTNLQSHIEDMRVSQQFTEAESEQLNARSKAMVDLNVQLQNAAAKAQTKTVDLELRRLEAQEAAEHLVIVQLFLPEGYKSERDSVLAYLRFKRVAFKAKLLHGFLKDELGGKRATSMPETVFVTCDIMDKLVWVSTLCERFVSDISGCSLAQFARYEGSLYELEPVERALNGYIEAWKRDELKERVMAEELQRSIALLTHLAEVHIEVDLESYADDVLMRTTMMLSHLEHSANALTFTRMTLEQRSAQFDREQQELKQKRKQALGETQEENTERDGDGEPGPQEMINSNNDNKDADLDNPSLVSQYVQQLESLISQARSAKVVAGKSLNAIQELKERSMSMDLETSTTFEQTQMATAHLAGFCNEIGKHLRDKLDERESDDNAADITITDSFLAALEKVRETSYADQTEPNMLLTLGTTVKSTASQLSQLFALTNDLSRAVEFTRSPSPWGLRSEALKASTITSVSTEEELKRLKDTLQERLTQLRLRDQTLEEQSVKIELLEARTKDANAKANKITELQAGLEHSKKRERELANVIEQQFQETQALQTERDRWKQVADETKEALSDDEYEDEGGSEHGDGDGEARDADGDGPEALGARRRQRKRKKGERAVATAREMDALRLEIRDLQGAVRFLRRQDRQEQAKQLAKTERSAPDSGPGAGAYLGSPATLAWLKTPLRPALDPAEKARCEQTLRQGTAVFDALIAVVVNAKPVDLSTLPRDNRLAWRPFREKSAWLCAKQREDWFAWSEMRKAALA